MECTKIHPDENKENVSKRPLIVGDGADAVAENEEKDGEGTEKDIEI
jgi:hypothetical protein